MKYSVCKERVILSVCSTYGSLKMKLLLSRGYSFNRNAITLVNNWQFRRLVCVNEHICFIIDWKEGWCLMCDVLLRLPLSMFVKLVHITLEVPGLQVEIKYIQYDKEFFLFGLIFKPGIRQWPIN